MSPTTSTVWTQVSPWLDELLSLDGAERQARLAAIARDDTELAQGLRALLAQLDGLDQAGFMAAPAQGPAGTAPAAQDADATGGALAAQPAGFGQVVGAYTLERLLGEGGMGAVWLARRSDGRFQGQVAIKFLQGAQRSPALARRFAREAQLLARLEHPHIARLLDAGLTAGDGQPYLVLEYVQGRAIDDWCEQQALDLRARLHLLLDVMDAVAHAHERLVLHRDLKPSNILVNTQGQVKLLDFGIARLLGDTPDGEPDLTHLAGSAYTPRWASPEQLGGGELTPASDVFALGLLMHRVLTGRHPLDGCSLPPGLQPLRERLAQPLPKASEQVLAQASADASSAGSAAPGARARARALRGDLDTVIAKALKPAPAERYRSAADLADDLRRHLRHEAILARPDSAAYRAGRLLRRHWLAVSAAGAVAGALLVGGGVALVQARQAQAERAQAEGLLEYMLGDLRDQLEPLGQLALLDGVGTRALAYYAGKQPAGLDNAGLARRSEALHVLGRIAQQRGRVDEMAHIAEQARTGSQLLLQRRPESPEALKLNARSLALAAWAAELQGRFDLSEAHYLQALSASERALALRPGDTGLQLSLADVQGEFAGFYAERGGPQVNKALPLFDSEHRTLLALVGSQASLWQNISINRSWVADALYGMGRYDDSLAALRQHRQAQDKLPGLADKPSAQWDGVAALNRESGVLLALDRLPEAEAASAQAVAQSTALVASDPSNVEWARYNALHLEQHASTLKGLGRNTEAQRQLQRALQRLQGIKPAANGESVPLQATWLRVLAALARLQPQDNSLFEPLRLRLDAELKRTGTVDERSESVARDVGRASLALGQLWAARGRSDAARQTWEAGLSALSGGTLRKQALLLRLDLLLVLDRRDEARAEAQALRASGWRYAIPQL